jgi:hypothetical protein
MPVPPHRLIFLGLPKILRWFVCGIFGIRDNNLEAEAAEILWDAQAGRLVDPWRRERESNPRIAVLQTAALPLRHRANNY